MNNTIKEAAKALGEMIKADEVTVAYEAAADAYKNNTELNTLITEYNVQQTALGEAYKSDEKDQQLIDAISHRVSEIYDSITKHPVYVAFVQSQEKMNELVNSVNHEITVAIYGEIEEECTHDCSTCGGGCGSHHHHHDDCDC